MTVGELLVKIGLDTSGFDSGMGKLNTELQGLKDKAKDTALASAEFKKVGLGITAAGVGILAFLGLAAKSAAQEETQVIRLSSVLKNVGVDYNTVKGDLNGFIESTEKATKVNDDELREGLIQLITITGSYDKSLKLLPLSLDLAAAKNINLGTAAMLVGKVAQGNTAMLSRYGIVLKEGATATEALDEMTKRFGGTAVEKGKKTEGAIAGIKNALDNLMESVGSVLLPVLTIGANVLSTLIGWLNKMPGPLKAGAVVSIALAGALALIVGPTILILGMLPTLTAGWVTLNSILSLTKIRAVAAAIATKGLAAAMWLLNIAMNANPIFLVVSAVAVLAAIAITLLGKWKPVVDFFKDAWEKIQNGAAAVVIKINSLMGITNQAATSTQGLTVASGELADGTAKLASELENENTLLDETNEKLKKAEDEYTHVKDNMAGYRDEVKATTSELDTHKTALTTAQKKLTELGTAVDIAKGKVSGLEDAISGINDEISGLTTPRLEGMQAFDDQIQAIQEKIDKLTVTKLTMESLGYDPRAYQDQIDLLKTQKELLEAQKQVEFGPALYKIKETTEQAQGLNAEMAPQSVLDRIAALVSRRKELSTQLLLENDNLTKVNKAYADQQAVVDGLQTEVDQLQGSLDILNKKIQTVYDSWDDRILAVKNHLYDLNAQIANTQARMDKLSATPTPSPSPTLPQATRDVTVTTSSGATLTVPVPISTLTVPVPISTRPSGIPPGLVPTPVTPAPTQKDIANKVIDTINLGNTGLIAAGLVPKLSHFALGGLIKEPTLLFGLKSRKPYAIAGEAGIEKITPVKKSVKKIEDEDSEDSTPGVIQSIVKKFNKVPASLVRMAEGGLIKEPALLYGLKFKKAYAIAGEAGVEKVVPAKKAEQKKKELTHIQTITTNLRKMALGGLIEEPTLLLGLKTKKPYAIAGETGPEQITPVGKEEEEEKKQKGFSLPSLKAIIPQSLLKLSLGGIITRPTLAMIGEQAPRIPEVVAPLDKLRDLLGIDVLKQALSPLRQLAMASAGGNVYNNINITMNGLSVREEADIDKIGQAIVDKIRLRQGLRI